MRPAAATASCYYCAVASEDPQCGSGDGAVARRCRERVTGRGLSVKSRLGQTPSRAKITHIFNVGSSSRLNRQVWCMPESGAAWRCRVGLDIAPPLLVSPKLIHNGVHFDAPKGREGPRKLRSKFSTVGLQPTRICRGPAVTFGYLANAIFPLDADLGQF
jgi:hypothetical protein